MRDVDVGPAVGPVLVMSADTMLTGGCGGHGGGGGSCWLLVTVVWSLHVLDDSAAVAALPPVIRIGKRSISYTCQPNKLSNGQVLTTVSVKTCHGVQKTKTKITFISNEILNEKYIIF